MCSFSIKWIMVNHLIFIHVTIHPLIFQQFGCCPFSSPLTSISSNWKKQGQRKAWHIPSPKNLTRWPWKHIGFQILLRTKYVPSLVKIHWRMLILECSQGCYVCFFRNACTESGSLRFSVFRLLTDFVCLYNYEFWLSLCKIVRSTVILLLPLWKDGRTVALLYPFATLLERG